MSVTPLLRILDDLAYVFECVAQDHMGECRYFMGILCDRIEQDPDYALADRALIASTLRESLALYKDRKKEEVTMRMAALSRSLWERVAQAGP